MPGPGQSEQHDGSREAGSSFRATSDNLWQFHAALGEGGLRLRRLSHDGELFAEDLGVARVWVARKDPKQDTGIQLHDITLGSAKCPVVPVVRSDGSEDAFTFERIEGAAGHLLGGYAGINVVKATFQTAAGALGEDTPRLTLVQRYVFTPWSSTPSHEPSGLLRATRIYPLVDFSFEPTAETGKSISYIRVDWRLKLSVGGQSNEAGVFKDRDKFPSLSNILSIEGFFKDVEKPLLAEMIGQGIDTPDVPDSEAPWDNIHVWRAGFDVPTPGVAYAAHMHWRWGATAANPQKVGVPVYAVPTPTIGLPFPHVPSDLTAQQGVVEVSKGGAQFTGLGRAGGPLIDYRVPRQRLRFAITDRNGPDEPSWNPANASAQFFDDLFLQAGSRGGAVGSPGHPKAIGKDGGKITVWVSIECASEGEATVGEDGKGTLFVHGIFFAHEEGELKRATLFGLSGLVQRRPTKDIKHWLRPHR
jgi:hypothetical protein